MTTIQISKLQDRAAWWEAHKYEWLLRQMEKRLEKLLKEIAEINELKLVKYTNLYIAKHGTFFVKTKFGFRIAKLHEIE